ncbi:MAG: cob(I)yrinic acid a,c-diamide adenosyltransferase [Alphaproteobacteria bacterium]
MVQLTRIYTKGGDKGKTSLGDGKRVFKDDPRIEAIGTVDEVNAWIGICHFHVSKDFLEDLNHIQHDLFDVGADLCITNSTTKLKVTEPQVTWLEDRIDTLNIHLSPLNSFVLPGGTAASSYIHGARTVSRRCERSLVHLSKEESLNPFVLSYINRLSDYLFVLARFENDRGRKDILWIPGKSQIIF